MLTKKRMYEIIDIIDSNLNASDYINLFNNEDKIFLTEINNFYIANGMNVKIEDFIYEKSLDKVIDDRTKKIEQILK
jgi:hypothetical protein